MFPKISPRNNDWNRKYGFNDENGSGFLIDEKNGLSFFGWNFKDGVKFYKCEQSVFQKGFQMTEEMVDHKLAADDHIHYLRYPMEV